MDRAPEDEQPVPTIRDVAERANVALSSVSRVLSGHPDVSDSMRERVETAARELGYEPDFLAQSLRRGRTQTVGLALRDISNPLFATIAGRCERALRQVGYSMLVTSSDGDVDVEARNLRLLRRRKVDGVIVSLVSETDPQTVAALKEFKVPVVLLDREVEEIAAGAVLSDHYKGTRTAVSDLLAHGHRRIVLVTGTPDVRSTRERVRAIRDVFDEAGLEFNADMVAYGTFDEQFGEAEATRLLTRSDPPTAILAGGVGPAMGAVRAARKLGRALGDDLTIVAMDEWPGFEAFAPTMPSVTRDADELGNAAARLLIDMLEGANPRTETLDTTFVQR